MNEASGFPLEDVLRDINRYVESGQRKGAQMPLPDMETFATIKAVYTDWTADVVLGQPQGTAPIAGPEFKRLPILTEVGDAGTGHCEWALPQVGQVVMVRFLHNRTLPVVMPRGLYFSPRITGQTHEQKKATQASQYFEDVADRGYVHQSGTKWKVKKNGNVELVKGGITVDITGSELNIANGSGVTIKITGSTIELGGGASMEALVKGAAFTALYNAHVHPTPSGPSSAPVVPMTTTQQTTIVKGA